MKINYPTNICKKCFSNVAEIKARKSPLSDEIIEVCLDCYGDYYDPEILEEEMFGDINEEH